MMSLLGLGLRTPPGEEGGEKKFDISFSPTLVNGGIYDNGIAIKPLTRLNSFDGVG